MGLPWWLSGKESARKSGDSDLIPGLERSPGEGNGNPRKSGDSGLIPGLERSPGEGNGNPLPYSFGEIPWTEERVGHDLPTKQQSHQNRKRKLYFKYHAFNVLRGIWIILLLN